MSSDTPTPSVDEYEGSELVQEAIQAMGSLQMHVYDSLLGLARNVIDEDLPTERRLLVKEWAATLVVTGGKMMREKDDELMTAFNHAKLTTLRRMFIFAIKLQEQAYGGFSIPGMSLPWYALLAEELSRFRSWESYIRIVVVQRMAKLVEVLSDPKGWGLPNNRLTYEYIHALTGGNNRIAAVEDILATLYLPEVIDQLHGVFAVAVAEAEEQFGYVELPGTLQGWYKEASERINATAAAS